MALARIARSGLRRSLGGRLSNEKEFFLEQTSTKKLISVPENGSQSYLTSVKTMAYMRHLSRGIRTMTHQQSPNALRVLEESESEYDEPKYAGLEATKPGEKPRVVVLGTGWGACRFLKGINTKMYDVVCISPRNHMVFTPLLASTCVGTLEFRSVAEPVSRIQSALASDPNSYFYLASCIGIDTNKHEVS